VVFLGTGSEMLGLYFKLYQDPFLRHPIQFLPHESSYYHPALIAEITGGV
jgi:hypothetical protein